MFPYLLEREQDEMLRTTVRRLTFPDGETRDVEAFRLVWSWFDRVIAYQFGPDEDELLDRTLANAEGANLPLGEALLCALHGNRGRRRYH